MDMEYSFSNVFSHCRKEPTTKVGSYLWLFEGITNCNYIEPTLHPCNQYHCHS